MYMRDLNDKNHVLNYWGLNLSNYNSFSQFERPFHSISLVKQFPIIYSSSDYKRFTIASTTL